MAKPLQKLELTWIDKGKEPQLEPRILIEDPTKSFGDPNTQNMLIHGDNLLALKALEQDYAGKIKCIYIDPPYNTGNAFEHYDDGVEHSLWLNLMKPRLEILKTLLSNDGVIWITLDDNEMHYLKVMCDEIFGRVNFISTTIWHKKNVVQNDAKYFNTNHDYTLVYSKNIKSVKFNLLPRTEEMNARYDNPDNDPRGAWTSVALQAKSGSKSSLYEITFENGVTWKPVPGTFARLSHESMIRAYNDNRLWFGKEGKNVPRLKKFLDEVKDGIVSNTIFLVEDVGSTQEAKSEAKKFNSEIPFDTPKPERLIERILKLVTNEGDIVLDSFLGSATTAAVAHKMNRRWIGIELGEHANTHCIPRLQQVIKGTDKGGITQAVNWQGGGGFKFYNLAPSLLLTDKYGEQIINSIYNAPMLAAAMAKQEGFTYAPSQTVYWQQGHSSEKDFIYTTTQFVTMQILEALMQDVQATQSVLICCKGFSAACKAKYANITIKKIPQMLIGRCEYGKDDYSLNIINLPHDEVDDAQDDAQELEALDALIETTAKASKAKKNTKQTPPSLF